MPVDESDLYAVLGLTAQATAEQIRRAYRTLVRKNHPDTRPLGDPADDPATSAALQQAIAAYAVLGDPARRAHYDLLRTTPQQARTPIRIRTVLRFPAGLPDQPPIQAGPVRWHRTR